MVSASRPDFPGARFDQGADAQIENQSGRIYPWGSLFASGDPANALSRNLEFIIFNQVLQAVGIVVRVLSININHLTG